MQIVLVVRESLVGRGSSATGCWYNLPFNDGSRYD